MSILRMINPVQDYAWGSTTMLSNLRFQAPSAAAQAELWMGSHPRGESRVVRGRNDELPLRSYLRDRVDAALGSRALSLLPPGSEAPELPFLLKILTAEKGLSIQTHPSREAAASGFERENREGVPLDAPHRNYRDTNHKPELICALDDFWGLRGFRPIDERTEEMGALLAGLNGDLPPLPGLIESFLNERSWQSWRAVLEVLIDPESGGIGRSALVERLSELLARRSGASNGRDDRYWWCGELLRQFPGDPGAFAPLYLNLVHLRAGEAMFLEAGVLHAYLYGPGIELMANSDNVLRSGCTGKHVDAVELLRNLSEESAPPEIIRGESSGCGDHIVRRYPTPAREFELLRVPKADRRHTLAVDKNLGPAVVLAIGGMVVVEADHGSGWGSGSLALAPTESAFVEHETRTFRLRLSPGAQAFVAGVPDSLGCGSGSGDEE